LKRLEGLSPQSTSACQNPPFSRVEIETIAPSPFPTGSWIAYSRQNLPFSRVEIETILAFRDIFGDCRQNLPFSRVEIETYHAGSG